MVLLLKDKGGVSLKGPQLLHFKILETLTKVKFPEKFARRLILIKTIVSYLIIMTKKSPTKTFCLIPFLINLTHEKPFAEATPYSIIRMKIQLQLYRGEYLNIL